ncbi:MAG: hypothetical protein FWH21_09650 [Kiritimatiellaeota bacterium]|nr:hypothetical protein [Kiritimatiellota bacterium]
MNIVSFKNLVIVLLTVFLLAGCSEMRTTTPGKAFKHWLGVNPPADMELFHAHYWQSAHWTKEYMIYLEFKPTQAWWDEVVKRNNLTEDQREWIMPSDAPSWFQPSAHSIRYRASQSSDQGSRYFRDPTTGICLIYEIQL